MKRHTTRAVAVAAPRPVESLRMLLLAATALVALSFALAGALR